MVELFGCSVDNIGVHLKSVFESGELKKSQEPKISRVQIEDSCSVNRKTIFYNMDAIIFVGYRVNYANMIFWKATKVSQEISLIKKRLQNTIFSKRPRR